MRSLRRLLGAALLLVAPALGLVAPRGPRAAPRRFPAPTGARAPTAVAVAPTALAYAGEASGLPDPTAIVGVFALLVAALAWTQFDMVQVVSEEEDTGAEGARRARDALARKRGYFRK